MITSREQEKDLKAYTCKTCGSTLFIAKNRNWFFEGDTGLGGLGCYTCGAKGKDNFVMDRDRIVEDVGEDDDYFDYERPLDFVTAAERRALLKKAKGDEDVANQMLIDQANAKSYDAPEGFMDAVIEKTAEENKEGDKAVDSESAATDLGDKPKDSSVEPADKKKGSSDLPSSAEAKPKKKKKKKKKKAIDATSDAKDSGSLSSVEVKQTSDTSKPKKKEPKKDTAEAGSNAKGSETSTSASNGHSEDKSKNEKPKKKTPESPSKKADDDGDPWDDLDALGI